MHACRRNLLIRRQSADDCLRIFYTKTCIFRLFPFSHVCFRVVKAGAILVPAPATEHCTALSFDIALFGTALSFDIALSGTALSFDSARSGTALNFNTALSETVNFLNFEPGLVI